MLNSVEAATLMVIGVLDHSHDRRHRSGVSWVQPTAIEFWPTTGDQRLAIELTNALLASGEGVETNLIAGRLVIAHRDLVPALYALRIRFRAQRLSDDAARAFELIRNGAGVNAGEVRRMLGIASVRRPIARTSSSGS